MHNAILKMRPRHLAAAAAVLATSIAGVVWAVEIDGEAAQAGVDSTPKAGGPRSFQGGKSTLPTSSLQPGHSVVDVALDTSMGPVQLVRSYSSSTDMWAHKLSSRLPVLYSPPFGRVPQFQNPTGYSLQWWHNYYSFVHHSPWRYAGGQLIEGQYAVRDQAGELALFEDSQCDPICWMTDFDTPVPRRLLKLDGGTPAYVLYEPGIQLVYLDEYGDSPPNGGSLTFLTRVQNDQGKMVAEVFYGGPACDMDDAGVPYVSAVRTADGQVLRFHYAERQNRLGTGGETACVLDYVTLDGIDGGSTTGDKVVQYGYPPDGGSGGTAGLLESAEWPLTGRNERYSYTHNADPVWELNEQYGSGDPMLITRQNITADDRNRIYFYCPTWA